MALIHLMMMRAMKMMMMMMMGFYHLVFIQIEEKSQILKDQVNIAF